MDKDFKIIIDQLRNNEVSSDRELALFLSSNTSWTFITLHHLVNNLRPDFGKLPIQITEDEMAQLIFPYLG